MFTPVIWETQGKRRVIHHPSGGIASLILLASLISSPNISSTFPKTWSTTADDFVGADVAMDAYV